MFAEYYSDCCHGDHDHPDELGIPNVTVCYIVSYDWALSSLPCNDSCVPAYRRFQTVLCSVQKTAAACATRTIARSLFPSAGTVGESEPNAAYAAARERH